MAVYKMLISLFAEATIDEVTHGAIFHYAHHVNLRDCFLRIDKMTSCAQDLSSVFGTGIRNPASVEQSTNDLAGHAGVGVILPIRRGFNDALGVVSNFLLRKA